MIFRNMEMLRNILSQYDDLDCRHAELHEKYTNMKQKYKSEQRAKMDVQLELDALLHVRTDESSLDELNTLNLELLYEKQDHITLRTEFDALLDSKRTVEEERDYLLREQEMLQTELGHVKQDKIDLVEENYSLQQRISQLDEDNLSLVYEKKRLKKTINKLKKIE